MPIFCMIDTVSGTVGGGPRAWEMAHGTAAKKKEKRDAQVKGCEPTTSFTALSEEHPRQTKSARRDLFVKESINVNVHCGRFLVLVVPAAPDAELQKVLDSGAHGINLRNQSLLCVGELARGDDLLRGPSGVSGARHHLEDEVRVVAVAVGAVGVEVRTTLHVDAHVHG